MGIVTFDPAAFKARYPEFGTVSSPTLQAYFDEAATTYLRNESTPIPPPTLKTLFNMIVAHIAALNTTQVDPTGAVVPASTIVGRISQAAEGSVNVSADYDAPPSGSQAWFIQTKYGAAFWQACAPWRTMRYMPNPTIVVEAPYPIYPN